MVLIKPLKYVLKLKHLVYIKFTISKCNLANVDILVLQEPKKILSTDFNLPV